MKKILLIDDSALMRRALSDIINKTNEYTVAYTAVDGVEGLKLLESCDDIAVCLCDVNMPRMSGLELLEAVKARNIKTPFIVISSRGDTSDTITALELGAVEFINKPEKVLGKSDGVFEKKCKDALDMAVESRREHISNPIKAVPRHIEQISFRRPSKGGQGKLVALVCSTGGPKALQQVLPKLPKNLAAPMVVVQHMPTGFTNTLASRMNDLSEITVKEAEEGERLRKGVVYVAKGGSHLTLQSDKGATRVKFDDSPPVVGLKPCGNIMYSSICDTAYDEIVCVVLTGMGADGTKGIKELAGTKAIYVIAQDEPSSTVYGMPKAIYESGLTNCVCDIKDVADAIIKKVGVL
jgi:two-component system chemotaxis response regulator CheB